MTIFDMFPKHYLRANAWTTELWNAVGGYRVDIAIMNAALVAVAAFTRPVHTQKDTVQAGDYLGWRKSGRW